MFFMFSILQIKTLIYDALERPFGFSFKEKCYIKDSVDNPVYQNILWNIKCGRKRDSNMLSYGTENYSMC